MSTDAKPEPFEFHYDGLRDEQGLIPAFGPVRLDDQGHIVMSKEEQRARMAAGIRALKALSQLPDDDPPGIEEEFMRNYDENHPHRPQFQGYY
jgi:hypothetical protein